MASLRSPRAIIFAKMRRCASRKKSFGPTSSTAKLNASLWIRIAPRTERSASRLCGSARSAGATVSGMAGKGGMLTRTTSDERRMTNESDEQRTLNSRQRVLRSLFVASARHSSPVARRLSVLLDDGDLQLRGHVAVQLDRDRRLAERLQRLGQVDLAAIDVEPLHRQRLRDVGGDDRTIELFGIADAAGNRQLGLRDPLRQRLGRLPVFGLARVGELALAFDQLLVPVGDEQGQLARQQKVARVAGRHLHHLATLAEVVHVLTKNDFHDCLYCQSARYGKSARTRARMIATRSFRWCFAQVPEIRRGSTLARSGTNPDSSFTS